MGFIEQISQKPKRYVSDILLLQQSLPLYEQEIYGMIDEFRIAIKKGASEVYKLLGFDHLQIKIFEILMKQPSTRKDLVDKEEAEVSLVEDYYNKFRSQIEG